MRFFRSSDDLHEVPCVEAENFLRRYMIQGQEGPSLD